MRKELQTAGRTALSLTAILLALALLFGAYLPSETTRVSEPIADAATVSFGLIFLVYAATLWIIRLKSIMAVLLFVALLAATLIATYAIKFTAA